MVKLGSIVRCRISRMIGTVIARTERLYGCVRITIQPPKYPESFTIDERQCELVDEEDFDIGIAEFLEKVKQQKR